MMKPLYWLVAVVAGAALVVGWQFSRTGDAATPVASQPSTPPPIAQASAAPTVPAASPAEAPATPAQVAQWIADTNSPDAAKRAAAINALAHAPRAESLPVLRRLVTGGEPLVDRPLALNSLRELALDQGDGDGGIRQAIRDVIYHGDDETLAASAQDALDVVEEAELKP